MHTELSLDYDHLKISSHDGFFKIFFIKTLD